MSDISSNSGPQLNSLRNNYNKLVSKRLYQSKSRTVQWSKSRRFGNI